MANQIQGLDIGRKIWQDMDTSDEAETELINLPFLRDDLGNLDDENEAHLTDDLPDFTERDLHDFTGIGSQHALIETYLTKNTPQFAERRSPIVDDAQQAHNHGIDNYLNQDVSEPFERGSWPLASEEHQELEKKERALFDIAKDSPGVDKRNVPTMFDMFQDIAVRLDALENKQGDMQEQIDELLNGKKLGKKVLFSIFIRYTLRYPRTCR